MTSSALHYLATLTLLLAGCAAVAPTPPAPVTRSEAKVPPLKEAAPSSATGTTRSLELAARQHAAQPKRALNIKTSCSFSDETGYNGRLDLAVQNDDVRNLDAVVNVPKRGACRFVLKDFHQDGGQSGVVLRAARGSCSVRLWEQEQRISVAFTNCAAQCSGGSHEYLWPILVDARTGGCS